MNATEKLVADYGIEAVNLRDVGREAEQRNNSVVQYHFGTKEILVSAVIDHRLPTLDAGIRTSLDELETSDRLREPGALAAAFVDPMLELDRSPEDRPFLGFLASIGTARHWASMLTERPDYQALCERATRAVAAAADVPVDVAAARVRLAWTLITVAIGVQDEEQDPAKLRDELIDAVGGLLFSPRVTAGAGA